MFRVGFGYDAHQLVDGRRLILGGVEIPHNKGLLGHSDADVLIHAVIDAITGALGRGDIGSHFPDSDPALKGISSLLMLTQVTALVRRDGLHLNNLDATVVAESPRLAPYIPSMREKMAEALDANEGQINIKATTTEGLGFCGRKEGIEAFAIISLSGA